MTNKVQININTVFNDTIDAYLNDEEITEDVLNRPIIQLGLNTGWLKNRVNELIATKEDKIVKRTAFNKDFGTTQGTVTEGNDPRLSDARPPLPHSHNLLDLNLNYNGSGFLFYNGTRLEFRDSSTTVSWDSITNVPTYFRASVGTVDGLVGELLKKANKVHTHEITDVNGLRQELDFLLSNRSIPAHNHGMDDVLGLTLALGQKADLEHTHPLEEIVGLRDELDARASSLHTHSASEISGLEEFVRENIPSIKIVRESFVGGPDSHTLKTTGKVFKVTLNGIDLEDSEWSQLGNILTVTGTEIEDRLMVYAQESPVPTITRMRFTAVEGDNDFTVAAGVSIWQVSVNGIDIEDFTQTGTTLTVTALNENDTVIAYGNTGV